MIKELAKNKTRRENSKYFLNDKDEKKLIISDLFFSLSFFYLAF
jgi:predicted transcriptional regulator